MLEISIFILVACFLLYFITRLQNKVEQKNDTLLRIIVTTMENAHSTAHFLAVNKGILLKMTYSDLALSEKIEYMQALEKQLLMFCQTVNEVKPFIAEMHADFRKPVFDALISLAEQVEVSLFTVELGAKRPNRVTALDILLSDSSSEFEKICKLEQLKTDQLETLERFELYAGVSETLGYAGVLFRF